MKPVWLLLISVASATLGQIFFKRGVFMTGEIPLKGFVIGELLKLVFNPFVFSGLVLYIISTIVWSLTVFIGLSLASAKRSLYLGPIFPPFALLAALGWDRIRERFPKVKNIELYGLTGMFLVYVGTYLLFIIPSERKQSLRPVFEAVLSQGTNGPVYLANPSERLLGASFFYLGKRTPVLNDRDLLAGRFEDRPGATLVITMMMMTNSFQISDRRDTDFYSKRSLKRPGFVSTRIAPEEATTISEQSGVGSLN